MSAETLLDERSLSKLRWRCRRGLLENDLFVERFFERHGDRLTEDLGAAMTRLMELADNDLLDLLLARREPEGELDDLQIHRLLHLLREPPDRQNSP